MDSENVKIKVSVLGKLQDLSNEEIGECVRSLIDFVECGLVPDKSDRLYKDKSLLITSAKRSATAIYNTISKKQNEIALSNDPTIKSFKAEFEAIYYSLHKMPYTHSKYDTQNTVNYLKKVEELMTQAKLPTTHSDVLKNAVLFAKRVVALNDRWINTNLCIGILSNMFNKLYVKIKDHDQEKRNNNISAEYITNAINDFVGGTESRDKEI